MSLEGSVQLTLGRLRLEAEVAVATGELVVLLGPNGAGKTTLLRALAGLVALERGRVVLDGAVLEDTAAGTWVPTERRPVGFVFQDYLLFPHLSALENVAFGLRARGLGRAEARRRAAAWLERHGRPGDVYRFDAVAVLTVSDTGTGVPADERPNLFRSLYRGRNAHHSGIPTARSTATLPTEVAPR